MMEFEIVIAISRERESRPAPQAPVALAGLDAGPASI
jgi:hypothetical protein